jgi:hypothetical protein
MSVMHHHKRKCNPLTANCLLLTIFTGGALFIKSSERAIVVKEKLTLKSLMSNPRRRLPV